MILSGEYMMMYGERAVAASLDLRTTLKFCELFDEPSNIRIEFPDVDLSLNISLDVILNFFSTINALHLFEDEIALLKHVQYFITVNGMWKTYAQRFSLQTFLFLLVHMAYHEELDIKSFHVHLTTQLPINAGLGSSSSFAVCLAACFLHWARLQKGIHNEFDDQELEKIAFYAEQCEKVIQNYMFGADHEVCVYGQVFKFQYRDSLNSNIKVMEVPRMKILLIDSRIPDAQGCLSKDEQILRMAYLNNSHIPAVNSFFNSMDKILKKIVNILNAINRYNRSNNLRRLENLYKLLQLSIWANQDLLYKLGLSHPKLDDICHIAQIYGFVGKLTGLGGYAYILLPPGAQRENITNLSRHLTMAGFNIIKTSVNCNGVNLDEFPNTDINLNIPSQLIDEFIGGRNYSYLVDDSILFLRHVQYFITVNDMQEMKILLINSKIPKDKTEQMIKVAAMKNAHADDVDEIMDSINTISLNVHQTFSAIKASNNVQQLQELYTTLQHVQYFITVNGMWTTYEQRFSLQTFFFLFIYMIQYEDLYIKSFRVHLTTELPIGAGLGSSTSFAVCIATCFLHWGRLQKGDDGAFSDIDLETISEYAKNCEEAVQNYIIEVDYDVCSYGQMETYAALGIYILLSQKLLYELGVSHPKLDSICAIAKTHGFAGKLTNFGGRYVYILLPPNTPREKITNLSTHLTIEGFTVTMTS
ncbi:mevalonate kinase, partial [Lasius niger]